MKCVAKIVNDFFSVIDIKSIVRRFFQKNGRISRKKIAFFLLFLNIITSSAVSIYIPCLKEMAIDLHTTNALMQMTIVAHLIGELSGRLLCSPLIDMHGNRAVILPALTISVLGHMGCIFANALPIFMFMRFVQALGASVVYIVSISVINELFEEREKSSVIGILELYQPIAWILSPFAGSIISEFSNWRLSFLLLLIFQSIGILFFWVYDEIKPKRLRTYSVSKLFYDYRSVLSNSYFIMYALIPGLFAGGYMIFATSCPFICATFFGNSSADIALFSGIPLIFYVIATFVYQYIVKRFGLKISKRIGTTIYLVFGFYIIYLIKSANPWSPFTLLSLMCIQCVGSAFLVPISVFKALQSSINFACIGASSVVVFRNIIMSCCITISAKFNGNITTIMSCVFMTVATVLVLIMTRRIIKTRLKKSSKN